MPASGHYIFQLRLKVGAMANVCYEAGERSAPTANALLRMSGIPPSTLSSRLEQGTITQRLEAKLANAVGFSPQWRTWNDRSLGERHKRDYDRRPGNEAAGYLGRDSASAFEKQLRIEKGLSAETFTSLQAEVPELQDRNVLMFEMEGTSQKTLLGEPLELLMTVIAEPGRFQSGATFRFRRLRIMIIADSGSSARIEEPSVIRGPLIVRDARIHRRGRGKTAHWFIEAEKGGLDGEYFTSDNSFSQVSGLEIGEQFRAIVSFNSADKNSVVVDGTRELSVNEMRVLAKIFSLTLPGSLDSQGWITLGVQRLKCVRA